MASTFSACLGFIQDDDNSQASEKDEDAAEGEDEEQTIFPDL